jgi:KUP system potassium uptake protein
MEISHTSDQQIGQIYLPAINWTLLRPCWHWWSASAVRRIWPRRMASPSPARCSSPTCWPFVVARYVWGWSFWRAFLGALPFAFIDLAFFSANSVKIADGGWFPLVFGLGVYLLLSTWKRGRDLLSERLAADVMETRASSRD